MSAKKIIGYGTLLDVASVGDTIGTAAGQKVYRPVNVPGYQRLFNLVPEHYRPSGVVTNRDLEIAAANARPNPDARLNAVIFEVSEEEYSALAMRERFYEQRETEVYCFETGRSLGLATIITASDDSPWVQAAPLDVLPKWNDIKLGWTGAYRLSTAFGDEYAQTTFMRDGHTLVADVYRDHTSGFPHVDDPAWECSR